MKFVRHLNLKEIFNFESAIEMESFLGFISYMVAPSLFRSSVGTHSKKLCFVGNLNQLWFSVGN